MSNYNFFYPTESDAMSDVKKNLTDNLNIIAPRVDITVIAAGADLPQTGSYSVGDRVFRNDPKVDANGTAPSNYLLISKDADYGWSWRPIQQVISPWITLPSSVISDTANWQMHPNAPLQMTLDSRGTCLFRGSLRKITAGIIANTTWTILKPLPVALRPNHDIMHSIGVTPIQSAAGKAGFVGGRVAITQATGAWSFRFANTNNGISQDIWLDGLRYHNSTGYFYGP